VVRAIEVTPTEPRQAIGSVVSVRIPVEVVGQVSEALAELWLLLLCLLHDPQCLVHLNELRAKSRVLWLSSSE